MGDGAGWKQLRFEDEPVSDWSVSLLEVLAPLETVERVFISSYECQKATVWGGSRDGPDGRLEIVDGLLPMLQQKCPRLQHLSIVADFRHTDLHEQNHNPYLLQEQRGRITVTIMFPPLIDPAEEGQARRQHGIHHTKLVMVQHAAALRLAIATCNLDHWAGRNVGEAVWLSPLLTAAAPDAWRLLPCSEIGRRCGQTLYAMVNALTSTREHAAGSYAGTDEHGARPDSHGMRALWADRLAEYKLEDLPDSVAFVASIPGDFAATPAVPRGVGRCEAVCLDAAGGDDAPEQPRGCTLLGYAGGPLRSWSKDREMCAALQELVRPHQRRGQLLLPLRLNVHVEAEPGNLVDSNALAVFAPNGQRVGYVPAKLAACVSPLLAANQVLLTAQLHGAEGSTTQQAKRQRTSADGASSSSASTAAATAVDEGALSNKELGILHGTKWFLNVEVHAVAGARDANVPPQAWLALAANGLRCNYGLHRLREVLHTPVPARRTRRAEPPPQDQRLLSSQDSSDDDAEGSVRAPAPPQWRASEQTAFASYSPCIGQKGFQEWVLSLVAAVRNDEDLNALSQAHLGHILEQAEETSGAPPPDANYHMDPRYNKELLSKPERLAEAHRLNIAEVRRRAADDAEALADAEAAALQGAQGGLRVAFSPRGARDMLYLPEPGQAQKVLADDATANATHAEKMLTSGLLAAENSHPQMPRRGAGYHSKLLTRRFETTEGARYGFTYVGSHNLSLNAWGMTSVRATRLLSCNSYEIGVVLLVPRGTPAAEAEAALGWAAQPFQFDPHTLAPLDSEQLTVARESVRAGVAEARAGGKASSRTEFVPAQFREADGGSRRQAGGVEAAAMPRSEEEEDKQLQIARERSLREPPPAWTGAAPAMTEEEQIQVVKERSLREQPQASAGAAPADAAPKTEEEQMQAAIFASCNDQLTRKRGGDSASNPEQLNGNSVEDPIELD